MACGGGEDPAAPPPPPPVAQHAVGGTVTGLVGTLVLANGTEAELTITANGSYATNILQGQAYNIVVRTQPAGQTCVVENGSGVVAGPVTNILVTCTTNTYTVGGSITGLLGVLRAALAAQYVIVGLKGSFGLAEDTADASVACRQVGDISFSGPLREQEEVFSQSASILFKKVRIVRMVDPRRNTLVYLTYSDRVIEGSPKNSTSSVPIMPWGQPAK
mgnify:CR=1 FL=1